MGLNVVRRGSPDAPAPETGALQARVLPVPDKPGDVRGALLPPEPGGAPRNRAWGDRRVVSLVFARETLPWQGNGAGDGPVTFHPEESCHT